jgi:hypothetical protein
MLKITNETGGIFRRRSPHDRVVNVNYHVFSCVASSLLGCVVLTNKVRGPLIIMEAGSQKKAFDNQDCCHNTVVTCQNCRATPIALIPSFILSCRIMPHNIAYSFLLLLRFFFCECLYMS